MGAAGDIVGLILSMDFNLSGGGSTSESRKMEMRYDSKTSPAYNERGFEVYRRIETFYAASTGSISAGGSKVDITETRLEYPDQGSPTILAYPIQELHTAYRPVAVVGNYSAKLNSKNENVPKKLYYDLSKDYAGASYLVDCICAEIAGGYDGASLCQFILATSNSDSIDAIIKYAENTLDDPTVIEDFVKDISICRSAISSSGTIMAVSQKFATQARIGCGWKDIIDHIAGIKSSDAIKYMVKVLDDIPKIRQYLGSCAVSSSNTQYVHCGMFTIKHSNNVSMGREGFNQYSSSSLDSVATSSVIRVSHLLKSRQSCMANSMNGDNLKGISIPCPNSSGCCSLQSWLASFASQFKYLEKGYECRDISDETISTILNSVKASVRIEWNGDKQMANIYFKAFCRVEN